MNDTTRMEAPVDQAAGLRRMFSSRTLRFIPVVSNPFVAFGGVLIERLCAALEVLQLETLVVDASERGAPPQELSSFDLREGVEPLSPYVSYLAARGLPVRWVDSRGSTRLFLDAVAEAAPDVQVVLVHGSAIEMARLFGRGDNGLSRPRPVLLCDDRSEAMTHAYAAMKVLAQRADWLAHDLLLCAPPASSHSRFVAERLAHCADLFLGGVQHAWAQIDPAEPPTARPSDEVMDMVRELLAAAAVYTLSDTTRDSDYAAFRDSRIAALPASHKSASI